MEQVVHSLDDLFRILDLFMRKSGKKISSLEVAAGLSPGLYSRWKKSNIGPTFLTFMSLISATQELEVVIRSRTAENIVEKKDAKRSIDDDILDLTHDFLCSTKLPDKILLYNFMLRLLQK